MAVYPFGVATAQKYIFFAAAGVDEDSADEGEDEDSADEGEDEDSEGEDDESEDSEGEDEDEDEDSEDTGDSGDSDDADDSDDDLIVCGVCGGGGDAASLLLCDGPCGCGFHMACLVPALTEIPPGDWYCGRSDCREALMRELF